MKRDSERRKYYTAKLHERKKAVHAHLSKELRKKMKKKTRAVGLRKGDTVKIMRGKHRKKEAKVTAVDVKGRVAYLEGLTARTARGKEVPVAFQPSNLMLVALEQTEERKALFAPEAFKAVEAHKPKPEAKHEHAEHEHAAPKVHEEHAHEKHEEHAGHEHAEHAKHEHAAGHEHAEHEKHEHPHEKHVEHKHEEHAAHEHEKHEPAKAHEEHVHHAEKPHEKKKEVV